MVGRFNDTLTTSSLTSWVSSDPLFVIGNGSGTSNRHNAMTVLKNGNTGIGTNTPKEILHIVGPSTTGTLLVSPNVNPSNGYSKLELAEDDDYTYGMEIYYNGVNNNLQILGKSGSTIYGPWLTISRDNGEVRMAQVYNDAVGSSPRDLYIDNTGKIGYVSSSRRYKKDIRPMEHVQWLYRLRPVNFTYKTDKTDTKQYGLIAEEVEKVNPLFVSYNDQGQVETVQYSQLITPMLKALQEQQKEIETLKKENAELAVLKEKIRKLEAIVGAMAGK